MKRNAVECAYTEYAVELYVDDEGGIKRFVRQIEVFGSYEEAEDFIQSYNEPLNNDEYLDIIFIDYDKYGDEIEFGSVV